MRSTNINHRRLEVKRCRRNRRRSKWRKILHDVMGLARITFSKETTASLGNEVIFESNHSLNRIGNALGHVVARPPKQSNRIAKEIASSLSFSQ